MEQPTFKRAKRIIALHYGSDSFKTRRLCMLFSNAQNLAKNEAVIKEATRILELRRSLGYEISNASIDATMKKEVHAQKLAYGTGTDVGASRKQHHCLVCKQIIECQGWLVDTHRFLACPGDCTLIADYYYTRNGSKLASCMGFKRKYGKAVEALSPIESFDAMLSYMLHLIAHRTQRQQRYAQQRNPTNSVIQTD